MFQFPAFCVMMCLGDVGNGTTHFCLLLNDYYQDDFSTKGESHSTLKSTDLLYIYIIRIRYHTELFLKNTKARVPESDWMKIWSLWTCAATTGGNSKFILKSMPPMRKPYILGSRTLPFLRRG